MNKNTITSQSGRDIILGSSSSYRKSLLNRLSIQFNTVSPNIDESTLPDEMAEQLVKRLTLEKAKAVAVNNPCSLIITSDQVAVLKGEILGKPGNTVAACDQLSRASGQCVTFLTGLCLLNSYSGQHQIDVIPYSVYFRDLNDHQILAYVEKEQPLDCAGSFKSEGLGIALFHKMEGDDPTALIGLPLIRLVSMLKQEGVDVLS